MSAPAETAQSGIPVCFTARVPDSYVPLPERPDQAEWSETLDRLMPAAQAEGREFALANFPRVLPLLRADEVVKTALHISVVADELAFGALVVGLLPTRHESALVTAESIYRKKKEKFFGDLPSEQLTDIDEKLAKGLRGPEDTLLATKLPVGPAVTSISLRTLTMPRKPGLGEDGPPVKMGIALCQLTVPAPRDYTLYFTIATPTLKHTSVFSGHLAAIGRTVTFDPDEVAKASRDTDAVVGRRPVNPPD
ncbi:hypothetical protein RM844_16665 [Streptomyces sp. DSM 44915]|uniref:Uncharacterized protein n=1 Tax=Streptomyces chisholmiae TaxID=3075540 RepID=A0ABU2JSE0_9ACTN|nr:hypothetical protein [Streptomyces sp. DSM 44915]MDT0267914.1 hypothetical protein [Streptomyces sp. DSM 44915]